MWEICRNRYFNRPNLCWSSRFLVKITDFTQFRVKITNLPKKIIKISLILTDFIHSYRSYTQLDQLSPPSLPLFTVLVSLNVHGFASTHPHWRQSNRMICQIRITTIKLHLKWILNKQTKPLIQLWHQLNYRSVQFNKRKMFYLPFFFAYGVDGIIEWATNSPFISFFVFVFKLYSFHPREIFTTTAPFSPEKKQTKQQFTLYYSVWNWSWIECFRFLLSFRNDKS